MLAARAEPSDLPTRPPLAGGSGRAISSVVRALDVLSDAWTFLILRESFFGVRRFDGFRDHLGIARNILSERLEHLVDEAILVKVAYQDRPARHEYRLTPAGRDFYPAIVELMRWGDRWRATPEGPPLVLHDAGSGRRIEPIVVCGRCRMPVSPFEVTVRHGPGAGPEDMAVPGRRPSGGRALFERGRPCSVARALSIIGDRWSFRILRESFFGVRRFDDLRHEMGIARNILADRLTRLVEGDVLERRLYQHRPERHEYVLTPAGLDLYPAFLLLMAWGDRWRRPAGGVPLHVFHDTCGGLVEPELVDVASSRPILAGGVSYRQTYVFPRAEVTDPERTSAG